MVLKDSVRIKNSLIIPVYKNEENIPYLLQELSSFAATQREIFEVVFVVDGSPDNSYLMLERDLKDQPFQSCLLSHSRNFGSFAAIRTGMQHAQGENIAVMAADLQEPLSLIQSFFDELSSGNSDVVFGQRTARHDGFINTFLSNIFWSFYRKFIISDMPVGGLDIFGCNAKACKAILSIEEPNSSLVVQLLWVGFRRNFFPYERKKREHGESAWSFKKRFSYMMDSIFSYSDMPIMLLLLIGFLGTFISFLVGVFTFIARMFNLVHVPGYAGIIIAIAFVGCTLLLTQGIIGCYLWRAFENSKKRPLSLIQFEQKFDGKK